MSKILIPYSSPFKNLSKSSLNFQNERFQKNRKSILSELKCFTGIPEIVKKLKPDTLYKLISTPEGDKLHEYGQGVVGGVFYKVKGTGISKHAKFKTVVNPNFIMAAKAAGSQILLISIAMQLNRIE
ncbi:MAG: hypothetical protein KAI79_00780 [Bacteroidales bacterium]|nr:hypothetical protein [Bacteroidales bacterium]